MNNVWALAALATLLFLSSRPCRCEGLTGAGETTFTLTPLPVALDPPGEPTPFWQQLDRLQPLPESEIAFWDEIAAVARAGRAREDGAFGRFLDLLSEGERQWFLAHRIILWDLVQADGSTTNSRDRTLMEVIARNLPQARPDLIQFIPSSTSDTLVIVAQKNEPQVYTTQIRRESHKQVLTDPFFIRSFVWAPQLAHYKRAYGMPLSPAEQNYFLNGFLPTVWELRTKYPGAEAMFVNEPRYPLNEGKTTWPLLLPLNDK